MAVRDDRREVGTCSAERIKALDSPAQPLQTFCGEAPIARELILRHCPRRRQ